MQKNSLKLLSGHEMPQLGLGTWLSKPGEVGNAVKIALSNGYHLIDCAHAYENQDEIGEALTELYSKNVIKREDIFITSKVWNTFHSYDLALKAVDEILAQLKTDYLDLCLIHWPMGYKEGGVLFPLQNGKMLYSDVDYLDTWRALEKCVQDGKVRSIGVSNFNQKQIQRVIDNSQVKPAVLQVELHPYFQQRELVEYCNSKGIRVTSYSSFGNPGSPIRNEKVPSILDDKVIGEIAKNHNKTSAQVILRALMQKGIAIIPKSISEARIKQNFDVFDFSLTEDELNKFTALDKNMRTLDISTRDGDHPHFPWEQPKQA